MEPGAASGGLIAPPTPAKTPLYFSSGQRQIPGMRGIISNAVISTLLPAALTLSAAHADTALDAIKQLPRDQAARIARIEAREGTPGPDRWYILTQDPAADNGVHEFVVSNGQILASRSISQFADSLKPEDMLGSAPLNVDSDKAAKLAQDYAAANGTVVTSLNYDLRNDGPDGAPAWTVSCLDDKGNKLGQVVVAADTGDVVSHYGFALEPEPSATPASTPTAAPRFETYAKPQVVAAASPAPDDSGDGSTRQRHPKKPQNVIVKTFQNVGRTLEKYDPF
jgi:hypothetical protein